MNKGEGSTNALYFHLYNIAATKAKPFKIVVVEEQVGGTTNNKPEVHFESHRDVSGVIVKSSLLTQQQKTGSDRWINLNIQIPVIESRLTAMSLRVNIASNGTHILIAPEQKISGTNSRNVKIIQRHTGLFDSYQPGKLLESEAEIQSYLKEELTSNSSAANNSNNNNNNNNNSNGVGLVLTTPRGGTSLIANQLFSKLSTTKMERRNIPKLASEEQKQNIEYLSSLMESGLLTLDEFNQKRSKVLGDCVLEYNESHLNDEETKRLEKLNTFRRQGIISEEELKRERKKIFDGIGRMIRISSTRPKSSLTPSSTSVTPSSSATPASPTVSGNASNFMRKFGSSVTGTPKRVSKEPEASDRSQSVNIDISVLNSSQLEQLKKMSQFVTRGIITQMDYDRKVAKMVEEATKAKKSTVVIKEVSIPTTQGASPFSEAELVSLSAKGKAEARRLRALVLKGAITIEDYRLKLKKMKEHEKRMSREIHSVASNPTNVTSNNKELTNDNKSASEIDLSTFSEKQQEFLQTMRDLIQRGLVTPQEYDTKVRQMAEQNQSQLLKLKVARTFQNIQRNSLEKQKQRIEAERQEAERIRIQQEKEAERIRKQREIEIEEARKKKEELERREREYREQQRLQREEARKRQEEEAKRREEQARLERERLEQQKIQEQEKQRLLEELARKELEEQQERERILAEQKEKQRLEEERQLAELERKRQKRAQEEKEREEKIRLENERLEKERIENERLEEERLLQLERLKKEQELLAETPSDDSSVESDVESDEDRERKRRERILRGEPVEEQEEEADEHLLQDGEEYYYGEGGEEEVEYVDEDEAEFNDPILDEVEMDEEQWDKIVSLINFVKQGFMSLEEYEESRNEILGIEVAYEDEVDIEYE